MGIPVKYKGTLIIIFCIYTRCIYIYIACMIHAGSINLLKKYVRRGHVRFNYWYYRLVVEVLRNYIMAFMMFYNNKFGNVSVTYIRKRVEVKWCFDVINHCFYDRKMQYKRCVINTTQWYPKFSTEDILYKTWKTNDTFNWRIILLFFYYNLFFFLLLLFKKIGPQSEHLATLIFLLLILELIGSSVNKAYIDSLDG